MLYMLAQYLDSRRRKDQKFILLFIKVLSWDLKVRKRLRYWLFPIPSPEPRGCWVSCSPSHGFSTAQSTRHSPNTSPALLPAHSLERQRHNTVHCCILSNNSESVSHSFVVCAHHLPQGTKQRMVTTELLCWLTRHWELQVSEQSHLQAPTASSKATTFTG